MTGEPRPATAIGANAGASAQQSGTAPNQANVDVAEKEAEDTNCPTCCKDKKICFYPGSKIRNNPKRLKEFKRQLAAQERGINSMSPSNLIANRQAFFDPAQRAAIEAKSAASNVANRKLYSAEYTKFVRATTPKPKLGDPRKMILQGIAREVIIRGRVRRHLKSVASLHNPDKIAGGDAVQTISPSSLAKAALGQKVDEFGEKGVNFSIGKQWGGVGPQPSRAGLLERHTRQQKKNGCKSPQAKLRFCKSKPGQPGEPAR